MSFKNLEPRTKQILIGAVVAITLIIAAAITNNINLLLTILGGIVE